jgi:hypothetical protein
MNKDVSDETLRRILKSQYHASLAMLKETIEQCPEELWFSNEHKNCCWQVSYHALFFAHLYLQPNEAAFQPFEHPDGIFLAEDDPPQWAAGQRRIPAPYSKKQVLSYCDFCDHNVDHWVDALNLHSADCGFNWYDVSKLEHQFVSIRHIQHHQAQLADRLRFKADVGIRWHGSGSKI